MVKVMILTNSLTGGGAERSMNLLSNLLLDNGYEICLVPLNSGTEDLIKPRCEIFEGRRPWPGSLLDTLKVLFKIQKKINSYNPNFLVLNCDLPEFIGSLTTGKHKLVAVEHTSRAWEKRTLLGKCVRLLLNLRKTKWIAVSSDLRIWPTGSEPISVIPNLVFTTSSRLKSEIEGQTKLVFIGRLSEEKDPFYFLEICKATSRPGLIIGSGILEKELSKKIKKENLNIKIIGHKPDPWVYVKENDLIIITSVYEGDGLVLLEAVKKNCNVLIREGEDLRRFSFPDYFYCDSIESFCAQIDHFISGDSKFLLRTEEKQKILLPRSESNILNLWSKILELN
jgi:glycosyltransferase involved in cell wall biosynthesis